MVSWEGQDEYYTMVCNAVTLQSYKKGFFQHFAEHVTDTAGPDWVYQFGQLKSDQEKIHACFYSSQIADAVHGPLQNIQSLFRSKCGVTAKQRRVEGVHMAKKGDFGKALLLLSQSVIRAPAAERDMSVDDGLSLALALWERSAVLLSMSEYHLALADLQFSLREKLPESYRPEAYFRMSDCYIGMKDKTKATVTMKIVSKLTNDDISWKKKTELQLKIIQQIPSDLDKPSTNKDIDRSLPVLTDGPNEKLPSVSKSMALVTNEAAGRFLVADSPIKAGDTLAVEEPFVSALLPDKFCSHCLHCFKRLKAPIPCPDCSGIAFCSEVCRDVSLQTYHKYECKYLDMLLGSGMSILCHVSLRIFTRTNLDYFLQLKSKLGDSSSSDPYVQFYNLVDHKANRSPTDFLHRTLMALLLLRVLQNAGYFGPRCNTDNLTDDEEFVGSLLLHQLQLLQFNAHEIYETLMKSPQDFKSTKLNYIGVGVYTNVAMFNHDCYPSVTRYFSGNKIILKAVRPVNPGELVSENYGPIFTKMSLLKRQQSLQSRYWFKCICTACSQDWPTYEKSDENIYTLRCHDKSCSGAVNGSIKKITKTKISCPTCKKTIKVEEMLLLIKTFVSDHGVALAAMKEGHFEKAIGLLCQYTNAVHEICYPPNKDLSLCQETLRSCWAITEGSVYYVAQ